jgi:hypothetical protein
VVGLAGSLVVGKEGIGSAACSWLQGQLSDSISREIPAIKLCPLLI